MNKIDLPAANPERVAKEIEHLVGVPAHQVIGISAKSGLNVTDVLDAIVGQIPAPVDQNI